jgi:hypothetical protein
MLHAELRGKASPEDTYAEDALTSTVFGTLFAVGQAAVPVLRAWLAKARPADEATSTWPTIAGVDDYWFWPRPPRTRCRRRPQPRRRRSPRAGPAP